MVWEPSVTEGFAEAFYQGKTVPQYFLDCLAWNNGLVSNGHLTLLYGVLTYGLWAVRGVSPLTLRLIAAILALASLVPAWFLARRLGAGTDTDSAAQRPPPREPAKVGRSFSPVGYGGGGLQPRSRLWEVSLFFLGTR